MSSAVVYHKRDAYLYQRRLEYSKDSAFHFSYRNVMEVVKFGRYSMQPSTAPVV
jgi:hypothetical protein